MVVHINHSAGEISPHMRTSCPERPCERLPVFVLRWGRASRADGRGDALTSSTRCHRDACLVYFWWTSSRRRNGSNDFDQLVRSMIAVEVVGVILIVLGVWLLAARAAGSDSDVQLPGVTIKAPASVLVLVLGVLVFLFPYSPWWPENAASPSGPTPTLAPSTPTLAPPTPTLAPSYLPSSTTTPSPTASLPIQTATPTPATPVVDIVLDIRQTYLVDIDTGTLQTSGADLWFEAVTATERYFTPRGGAQLADMGSIAPGLPGCATASVSGDRISVDDVPVGDFLCLQTAAGRIAEIQLVDPIGPSPGTMRLHVRTFAP